MFILEAGKNHFGKISECKKIINFFQKSTFNHLTFMCQSKSWYREKEKRNQNFKIKKHYYQRFLNMAHKKKKKIGLSVCDVETFNEVKSLNFDFYKLLSIAINNYDLINELKKKQKTIYISTGFNASYDKIQKCLKNFKNYKKVVLLHTPMVKYHSDLNFKKILILKKKFNLDVGYSNHFKDLDSIYMLSYFKPKVIMLYIKNSRSEKIKFPDDKHAIYLDDLEKIKKKYKNLETCF